MARKRKYSEEERRLRRLGSARKYREDHREEIREAARVYHQTHKEQERERGRKYNETHKEQRRQGHLVFKNQHPSYYRDYSRRRREEHPEEVSAGRRRTRNKNKLLCLNHYSNGQLKCACCGESCVEFLTIDHISGGGYKQRKTLRKLGTAFYEWLIKNRFPQGFQVLCMNCNWGKAMNQGICPHKKVIINAVVVIA